MMQTSNSKQKHAATPSKASELTAPPQIFGEMPQPEKLLDEITSAPEIVSQLNIFPMEWRVETPRLMDIYESARDPGWSPSKLPWDSFDPDTLDPAILAQLVCPACYGDLRLEGAGLLCPACRRAYAIVDGIPVMIVERAERLAEEP